MYKRQVYKPDSGKVLLDGTDITGKNTIEINKAGIARTFQNIRLFKQLSVLDNVKVGLHNKHHYSTLSGVLRLPDVYKRQLSYSVLRCTKWSLKRRYIPCF